MNASTENRLLWIGWDGADWEHIRPLLDQGLMPNLQRLINTGVSGNLATLQPALSPMLWTSAATGKHAPDHGILGFSEPDEIRGGARPFSSQSRRCMAIWNMLTARNRKSNVINWWASHPAESIDGCVVSNLFEGIRRDGDKLQVADKTVYPSSKQDFYSRFKVFPKELTAEQLCPFVPLAAEIDQLNDSRLDILARSVAEMLSTHAVATAAMELEQWDFTAVYYTAIDHFCHAFMQYSEPKQSHISEMDFRIFKDVVTGCYRFSDMMLGRLIELCDDSTTIVLCSDHGFYSGHRRPIVTPREPAGPAACHREFGIFVAAGPNIKKGDTVCGASLIDVCPTLLALLNLPIGRDMAGRALHEIFVKPPELQWIDSWELEKEQGLVSQNNFDVRIEKSETNSDSQNALMQHFEDLGYVDHHEDLETQETSAKTEISFNLARSQSFLGQYDKAAVILTKLVEEHPWESRFISNLASCFYCGKNFEACRQLIEQSFNLTSTTNQFAKLLWCECALALRIDDKALRPRLGELSKSSHAGILNRVGNMFLKLRDLESSETAFLRALKIDSDNAESLSGMAAICTKTYRNEKAVDFALRAVGLIYQKPKAHLYLGIGAARLGHYDKALIALEKAIELNPELTQADSWIAFIHRQTGDEQRASMYRLKAARTRAERVSSRDSKLAVTNRMVPSTFSELERIQVLNQKRPRQRDPKTSSGRTLNLVSGLPRSGTSLMMRMLEIGGLAPQADKQREADAGNPNGYYEWGLIKKVKSMPYILDEVELDRRIIKVVSPLIEKLPSRHNYKVVFMMRSLDEVLASQEKLIRDIGQQNQSHLQISIEQLEKHRASTLDYLDSRPEFEVLRVDYHDLLKEPNRISVDIREFFGQELLPDSHLMPRAVDLSLYRQRRSRQCIAL